MEECPKMYVQAGGRRLRCGYTTGSCAAAAAKAALEMLVLGGEMEAVGLTTPSGARLLLPVEEIKRGHEPCHGRHGSWVSCGVRKDGGDDPDATHGMLIVAKVSLREGGDVIVVGGPGIGRVTRPGLDQPVGEAAINRVPRSMIARELNRMISGWEESGLLPRATGARVEIQAPMGEEVAKRTFNPRLGIQGGISIIGTTGIVVPMSEEALKESIRVQIRQRLAEGAACLAVSPGNYGKGGLTAKFHIPDREVVLCSNYIGAAVDMAVEEGAKGILLAGHLGKLVKVAAGVMDTHSRQADARMETLAAHALLSGASRELALEVLGCSSTDEAWPLLVEAGIGRQTAGSLLEKICGHLKRRSFGKLEVEAALYSHLYGWLGASRRAEAMAAELRKGGGGQEG